MEFTKTPNLEPILGYRLLEPLGSGGFGEVWKCEAPGGLFKAIKFVPAGDNSLIEGSSRSREELRAIQHIRDIRHPFLVSMERVEVVGDDLVIVMELADQSLDDLLRDGREAGQAGLPRADLLRYLTEAAEVLDLMHLEYGLQHLDVKPRNLFLVRGHVKVADFGLVQSLGDTQPRPGEAGPAERRHLSAVTPLYAAPELFKGALSPHCDQYSLAIVYHELLTGQLPFTGKSVRQLMYLHTMEQPALDALPAGDRPVIARAMAKEPGERFASCTDLVRALAGTAAGPPRGGSAGRARVVGARTRPGSSPDMRNTQSVAATVPVGPSEGRALPDYRFVACLGRDPLGETWEAQSADGKRKLVNFLYAAQGADRHGQEALLHLQALRHPALLPLTVVPAGPGCLAVVTDLVETSLRQRFHQWQARGERGIPRPELLAHLHAAAEALDQLYQQHGLQHLDLNPARLLVDGRRVLLGDFGLAQLLWVPAGTPSGQAQKRYSAPELAQRLLTRSCDQFSLAVIYQEMLTGHHPFRGRVATAGSGRVARLRQGDARSGRAPGRNDGPNLDALPPGDREVIARALDLDPERRFATCLEFVRALRAAGGATTPAADTVPLLEGAAGDTLPDGTVEPGPRDRIAELFREAKELCSAAAEELPRERSDGEAVEGRFVAILPPSGAVRKFDGFRQHWGAKLVESGETSAVFQVGKRGTSWIPWRGGGPSLLVEVRWTRPHAVARKMPEVAVRVRPAKGTSLAGSALLQELGPRLLESVQAHLLGNPERRNGERVLWPHPVALTYVAPDRNTSVRLECQGKDLSLAGLGLYLPATLPTAQVRVGLTTPSRPEPVVVSGSVVRIQRWDDQLFEVGILFD